MDMRGQARRDFSVSLHHAGGYRFVSQASEDGRLHGPQFPSDEPDPVGDASAPATPAPLGAAVGHCLSASLLETLRRAHLPVLDMQTEVTAVVVPNTVTSSVRDGIDIRVSVDWQYYGAPASVPGGGRAVPSRSDAHVER